MSMHSLPNPIAVACVSNPSLTAAHNAIWTQPAGAWS